MAEHSAQAKPAGTRIEDATNDVAIKDMIPAIETIEAFAREIAEMTWQAVDRADQCIEELRKADRIEEAAAIQADFLKESMEHAVRHTKKYIEMLATFPLELVEPVNVAVAIAEVAGHATAPRVEQLSEVARNA